MHGQPGIYKTQTTLIVDKSYAAGYGGSVPPSSDFGAARRGIGISDFRLALANYGFAVLFFDIAGVAGVNGKRATARGTGRGVDCRISAIHPAPVLADGCTGEAGLKFRVSDLGSRISEVEKCGYVRLSADKCA